MWDTNWLDIREGLTSSLRIREPDGWREAEAWEVAVFVGMPVLAEVIRTEEGTAIVREGMADVLHWLRECECYDSELPGRMCAWRQREFQESLARVRASFERVGESMRSVGMAISDMSRAYSRG